jgi:predicted RNase H-like HicB family nuclease
VPLGLLIAEANQKVGSLPQEWSETLMIAGRSYRLLVTRDADQGDYVAECRELPGFMKRAKTPVTAVEAAAEAMRDLLAFREKRQRHAHHGKAVG